MADDWCIDDWSRGDSLPDDIEQILKSAMGVSGWGFWKYETGLEDISMFRRDDVVTYVKSTIDGNPFDGEISLEMSVCWGGPVTDFDPTKKFGGSGKLSVGLTDISNSNSANGETLEGFAINLKQRMLELGVESLRESMDGIEFLVNFLSTAQADVRIEDTPMGAVASVADRLARRFGHDPSNRSEREMAEILAGFLEGEKQTLERVGTGETRFAGTNTPFDEWWGEE